jgi:EAL domain-containing protein (putative c-di-GMP-specific phosphodiesterase class I)
MARRIDIAALVDRHNLRPVYQPVVDLDSGEEVGAEALARWPQLDVTPNQAFSQAMQEGQLSLLDEACRDAAIDIALEHGVPPGFRLFVNLEPSTVVKSTMARLMASTRGKIELVVEITERELLTRPAELLRAVHELRSSGCGIALDDVGAVPDSLALLSLVSPDVVKLDLSLIQQWPDIRQGAIIAAVAAYSERTGATILAEGIETETHLTQALALGATLGQGWYFSRPGTLGELHTPAHPFAIADPTAATPATPFSAVDPRTAHIGPKGFLLGISRHLESQGLMLRTPPVVLGAFQETLHFTRDTALRYARLADRCPLVGAVGVGLSAEPIPGVRGVSLAEDDPFRGEWTVAVIGAHFTGALIARDLGDQGPDRDRRFAFVLTHDSATVLAAARSILERVEPTVPAATAAPAMRRMIHPVRPTLKSSDSVRP